MADPQKGRPKTPGSGRKKGVPNKTTAALKDMILKALDESGGVKYLVAQAHENPTAFLTLVGRVLPHTITGDGQKAITVEIVRYATEGEEANEDSGD
jgi:hypothetical protein